MTKTREYIQDKNIEILFEELMRLIINEKPENPIAFLISSLQEKGESLLSRKPTICSNGPSMRERRSLKCDGQALNIRKSLERILPKSCEPKPSTSIEKGRRTKSATSTTKYPKPALKVVKIPSGEETVKKEDQEASVQETKLEIEDVVVSQSYVQDVQSIFNFGRKKKSSVSDAESDKKKSEKTDSSGSDGEEKIKKKKKKKKKKRSDSEDEESDEKFEKDEKGKESPSKENSRIDINKTPSVTLEEEPEDAEPVTGVASLEEQTNQEKSNEDKSDDQEEDKTDENIETALEQEDEAQLVEKEEVTSETNTVMVTASCDLTELASWRGDALDVESLLTEAGTVEHGAVRNVQSAPPPPLLLTKNNEEFILREETFSPVRSTLLGSRDGSRDVSRDVKRGSSPCKTVFFEEQDDVPVISDPQNFEATFRAPEHIARLHEKFASLQAEVILSHHNIHNNGDDLSISELSGSPWTYAESTS